jgi:hypothetical protein
VSRLLPLGNGFQPGDNFLAGKTAHRVNAVIVDGPFILYEGRPHVRRVNNRKHFHSFLLFFRIKSIYNVPHVSRILQDVAEFTDQFHFLPTDGKRSYPIVQPFPSG